MDEYLHELTTKTHIQILQVHIKIIKKHKNQVHFYVFLISIKIV